MTGISPARRLAVLGCAAGLILAFFALGLNRHINLDQLRGNEQSLRAYTDRHYFAAMAGFVTIYIAMVALSLPGATIMTITGGLLFGLWPGAALNVLGATTGAIILFVLARFVFSGTLQARGAVFLARMAGGFARHGFSYLMLLRLIPLFPFWAVNLAAAAFGISLRSFALATLIGIIPGALAYTAIGDGLSLAAGARDGIGGPAMIALRVGLALLALVPFVVQKLKPRSAR